MNVDIELYKIIADDSHYLSILNGRLPSFFIYIFKSINELDILLYLNDKNYIFSYNLLSLQMVSKIIDKKFENIKDIRHCIDNYNKRDLLISVNKNQINLWDFKNWECLKNFDFLGYNLFSACFLNNKNTIFILFGPNKRKTKKKYEPIQVYDLEGNKITQIFDSNDYNYFIDTFYDNKLSKYFIISGSNGKVLSYDYNQNKLYKIYKQNENSNIHSHIIININEENIRLIEASFCCYIYIWDFHSGNLLKSVNSWDFSEIGDISLLNNNFIFAIGYEKNIIQLINIDNKKEYKKFVIPDEKKIIIKKINHYKLGNCLITKDKNNLIKLWLIKNK